MQIKGFQLGSESINAEEANYFFNVIIRSIYSEYPRSVMIGEKIYYNGKNRWYDYNHSDQSIRPTECQGYWNGECTLKRKLTDKPYKFIFKDHPLEIDDAIEYLENSGETSDQMIQKVRHLTSLFESGSRLVADKRIIIRNDDGINEDHRGSDHLKYILPFFDEVSGEYGFSFDELRQAVYKVKSHHWDEWYELFTGVRIDSHDQSYIIHVTFDHGS